MRAGVYNFTIEQGSRFHLPLTWKDSQGNPIDFTGLYAGARLEARNSLSADPLISLTSTPTSGDRIELSPSTGQIDVYLTTATTAALTFDEAYYDLELVLVDGSDADKLFKGMITLVREATT